MLEKFQSVEIVDMKKPEPAVFPCKFSQLPSGVYLDTSGHLVFWERFREVTYHLWDDGEVCSGDPREETAVRRITKIHFE